MSSRLTAISPIDGRYASSVGNLSAYFSETALMTYRLKVEIEYLIALANEKGIKELTPFSGSQKSRLRKLYQNFTPACAKQVKTIEATTNHDVKAIEYYIQGKVKKSLHPWIHFWAYIRRYKQSILFTYVARRIKKGICPSASIG